MRTWRQQLLPWLKAGEQGASPERSRLSRALVVLQLAFSVLLLTSAGLAHRSIALLDSGDVGFDKEQLVLVTVRARRTGAAIDAERSPAEREASFATLERVRERLTAVPNVTAVSYSRRWPGAYALGTVPAWRTGQPEPVQVMLRPVGPDYLQVLAVSPLAGREITRRRSTRQSSHRGRERKSGDHTVARSIGARSNARGRSQSRRRRGRGRRTERALRRSGAEPTAALCAGR